MNTVDEFILLCMEDICQFIEKITGRTCFFQVKILYFMVMAIFIVFIGNFYVLDLIVFFIYCNLVGDYMIKVDPLEAKIVGLARMNCKNPMRMDELRVRYRKIYLISLFLAFIGGYTWGSLMIFLTVTLAEYMSATTPRNPEDK